MSQLLRAVSLFKNASIFLVFTSNTCVELYSMSVNTFC